MTTATISPELAEVRQHAQSAFERQGLSPEHARLAAGAIRELNEHNGTRGRILLQEPGRAPSATRSAAPPAPAPAPPPARPSRETELRRTQALFERQGMSPEAARHAALGREPRMGDAAALGQGSAIDESAEFKFFRYTCGMSEAAARAAARGR